jgi:20S proteasome alpha/beta subunit
VLLFASDTQESSEYIKRPVTKLRVIRGKTQESKTVWNILVASAGDAMVANEAVDDVETFLQDTIRGNERRPSLRLGSLREKIGDLVYSTYEKHRLRVAEGDQPPYFTLLIGAADETATILLVTCEGKQQILEQSGMIGSGLVTGGELLLREFIREDMSQREAASLAALIVTSVGNVDAFVGGEPEIKLCRNRRVWHYEKFKFKEIMKESQSRWHLIKKVWWKIQDDSNVKRKLSRALIINGGKS